MILVVTPVATVWWIIGACRFHLGRVLAGTSRSVYYAHAAVPNATSECVSVSDVPRHLAKSYNAKGLIVASPKKSRYRWAKYAHDAKALASFATPDVTVDRIGDLLNCDLGRLLAASPRLEAAQR